MSDPLAGARRKIERAEKHFADFNALRMSFLQDPKPYRIVPEYNRNGYVDFVFMVEEQIPDEFSLVFGDAVHNLRSALDHAICALIQHNGHNIEKKHRFPVFGKIDPKYLESRVRGAIDAAGSAAVKIVTREQPYEGGNSFFGILHKLDIDDKHKVIIPAFSAGMIVFEDVPTNAVRFFPDTVTGAEQPVIYKPDDGGVITFQDGIRMKDGEVVASITRPVKLTKDVQAMVYISFDNPFGGRDEAMLLFLNGAILDVKRIVNDLAKTI